MDRIRKCLIPWVWSSVDCIVYSTNVEIVEFIESVEDLICFMFDVAAAAVGFLDSYSVHRTNDGYQNELLLERLVLICASVILAHCNLHSACSILEDATYYHIEPLVERLQEYISINMETFLQNHMLDEFPDVLVKELAQFVKTRQIEKSPFSRSDSLMNQLLAKHAEWLAEHIPSDIVRTASSGSSRAEGIAVMTVKTTPKPPIATKTAHASKNSGKSLRRPPSGDDIFIMDNPKNSGHPASYQKPAVWASLRIPGSMWKPTFTPR